MPAAPEKPTAPTTATEKPSASTTWPSLIIIGDLLKLGGRLIGGAFALYWSVLSAIAGWHMLSAALDGRVDWEVAAKVAPSIVWPFLVLVVVFVAAPRLLEILERRTIKFPGVELGGPDVAPASGTPPQASGLVEATPNKGTRPDGGQNQ